MQVIADRQYRGTLARAWCRDVRLPHRPQRVAHPRRCRPATYSSTHARELRHIPSAPRVAFSRPSAAATLSASAETASDARAGSGTSRAGPPRRER